MLRKVLSERPMRLGTLSNSLTTPPSITSTCSSSPLRSSGEQEGTQRQAQAGSGSGRQYGHRDGCVLE